MKTFDEKTFFEVFVSTGSVTPAGGKCYIHPTEDMCANVYTNKIRVFYNRQDDIATTEKAPVFYEEEYVIDRKNAW